MVVEGGGGVVRPAPLMILHIQKCHVLKVLVAEGSTDRLPVPHVGPR